MAGLLVMCIVNPAKEAQADTFPPKKEKPPNIPARPWQLRKTQSQTGTNCHGLSFFPKASRREIGSFHRPLNL